MYPIPFTQYHLPNGRKTFETFECKNDTTIRLAKQIIDAGGVFEAEILRNGTVSLTVVYRIDDEEQDIAIELCRNDSGIVAAIDALVLSAWTAIKADKRKDVSDD